MSLLNNKITRFNLLAAILLLVSCATVPKEVVELNYAIGNDLKEMHLSYQQMVTQHFNLLKDQVNYFIDKQYKPTFLKDFIETGQLVARATTPPPDSVLARVDAWVKVAIDNIETLRDSLLTPVEADEKEIKTMIDDAFYNMIRGNAVVTAHLNSIRKVQDVQNDFLQALHLKDIRDKINDKLIKASEKAEEALKKIQK